MYLQIKIWFQNRRTKWKRKYTSDVESLASQYYAQIGIGNIARPMVVGDRLWLFSQNPNATNHPQTILANNSTSMAFRGYGGNQPLAASTALQPTQQLPMFGNHLSQNSSTYLNQDPSIGYDYNKSETLYRQFLSSQTKFNPILPNTKYRCLSDNNLMPANHSKTLLNKLFWSNEFANKPIDNNYDKIRFPYDGIAFNPNVYNGEQSAVDSNMNASNGDVAMSSNCEINGIAELERVFGSNDKNGQTFSSEIKYVSKKGDNKAMNGAQDRTSDCCSEESDVDCEKL